MFFAQGRCLWTFSDVTGCALFIASRLIGYFAMHRVDHGMQTFSGEMFCIRSWTACSCQRPARSSGFHCFRHSAGSFVNSQTGNMKLAQRLLGHSRYETTANVYRHALSGEERAAAFALEEAIFGRCSQLFPNENTDGRKTVN